MFTIIAWVMLPPALVWNVIFFGIALGDIFGDQKISWNRRNLRDSILSLAFLFVPGIYLFVLF